MKEIVFGHYDNILVNALKSAMLYFNYNISCNNDFTTNKSQHSNYNCNLQVHSLNVILT